MYVHIYHMNMCIHIYIYVYIYVKAGTFAYVWKVMYCHVRAFVYVNVSMYVYAQCCYQSGLVTSPVLGLNAVANNFLFQRDQVQCQLTSLLGQSCLIRRSLLTMTNVEVWVVRVWGAVLWHGTKRHTYSIGMVWTPFGNSQRFCLFNVMTAPYP